MESLRVLKKGGVFAINDSMKASMYGDVSELAEELRRKGFEKVEIVDTAKEVFGSHGKSALMFLPDSTLIVGRK